MFWGNSRTPIISFDKLLGNEARNIINMLINLAEGIFKTHFFVLTIQLMSNMRKNKRDREHGRWRKHDNNEIKALFNFAKDDICNCLISILNDDSQSGRRTVLFLLSLQ